MNSSVISSRLNDSDSFGVEDNLCELEELETDLPLVRTLLELSTAELVSIKPLPLFFKSDSSLVPENSLPLIPETDRPVKGCLLENDLPDLDTSELDNLELKPEKNTR